MATAQKPVVLQINVDKTWRDVVPFDASDDLLSNQLMDVAARLGGLTGSRMRIVTDDGLRMALTHFTPQNGWRND